jgi:hypothetical protein
LVILLPDGRVLVGVEQVLLVLMELDLEVIPEEQVMVEMDYYLEAHIMLEVVEVVVLLREELLVMGD